MCSENLPIIVRESTVDCYFPHAYAAGREPASVALGGGVWVMLKKCVLLLGNYRPSVALARQLDNIGYTVILARDEGALAAYSRTVSEVWEHKFALSSAEFLGELVEFLENRPEIEIVVPVQESSVLMIARNVDKLPKSRTYATPAADVVETCLDKVSMLRIVDALEIPSASARVVEDYISLTEAAATIGSPLIVRPLSSSKPINGRKAHILKDAGTLSEIISEWPAGHDVLIVQRYVDGPRYNVDFVAQNGTIVRAVATKILRTDAYDGTGIDVSGKTVPMPEDLFSYTERIASHFNYTGVGLAQYMVDREKDETTFLEVNPRFNGNLAVPEKAGLEFSRLAIDLALNPSRQIDIVISNGGLRHAWFFGDFFGVLKSWKQGMIGTVKVPIALMKALSDAVTADHHIVWSRSDYRPAVSQFGLQLKRGLGQLRREGA